MSRRTWAIVLAPVLALLAGCAQPRAYTASRAFFKDDFDTITYGADDPRLWEAVKAELRGQGFTPGEPSRDLLAPSYMSLTSTHDQGEKSATAGIIPGGHWTGGYVIQVHKEGGRATLRVSEKSDRPGFQDESRAPWFEYCILKRVDPAHADALASRWRERMVAAQVSATPLFEGTSCAQ